jgi:hypothetical protein
VSGDVADGVGPDAVGGDAEAVADPVGGAGTGDDELHLVEVERGGVVEVDRELVGQEVPERGERPEDLERLA